MKTCECMLGAFSSATAVSTCYHCLHSPQALIPSCPAKKSREEDTAGLLLLSHATDQFPNPRYFTSISNKLATAAAEHQMYNDSQATCHVTADGYGNYFSILAVPYDQLTTFTVHKEAVIRVVENRRPSHLPCCNAWQCCHTNDEPRN